MHGPNPLYVSESYQHHKPSYNCGKEKAKATSEEKKNNMVNVESHYVRKDNLDMIQNYLTDTNQTQNEVNFSFQFKSISNYDYIHSLNISWSSVLHVGNLARKQDVFEKTRSSHGVNRSNSHHSQCYLKVFDPIIYTRYEHCILSLLLTYS